MSKASQRIESATAAGKLAAREGLPKNVNPHKKGKHINCAWHRGWAIEKAK